MANREVHSFPVVFRELAPAVWRMLRRVGVEEADVDDVCQEVFLTVHNKLASFEGRSTLRTWVYGIAVRCASDHRRRAYVQKETPTTDLPEPISPPDQEGQIDDKRLVAILDEILKRIEQHPADVRALDAGEDLLSRLKSILSANAEFEPKDLDYAKAALRARKELREKGIYIAKIRSEMSLHQSREVIKKGLAAAVKRIQGNNPSDADFKRAGMPPTPWAKSSRPARRSCAMRNTQRSTKKRARW